MPLAAVAHEISILGQSPKALAEQQLVSQALAGCDQAWTEIVEKLRPLLYKSIIRIVKQHEDAEDLVQDALLKIFTKLNTFRGDSALSSWAYRVAMNECWMSRRGLKPELVSLDAVALDGTSLVDSLADPADFAGRAATIVSVRKAVDRLPRELRDVLLKHDVEGYRYEELAADAGCAPGTLRSRAGRARRRLRGNGLFK